MNPLCTFELQQNVPLSRFTTLRVGGPARFLSRVKNLKQLQEVLEWAAEQSIKWIVIGKGSNLLVNDKGFDGLVIVNAIDHEVWQESADVAVVRVGAGVGLASLAARAAKRGWAGLEFACGIPATIGGAVTMNAGAHGVCLEQVLAQIQVWDGKQIIQLDAQSCDFGYRHSRFQSSGEVVIEAIFHLKRDGEALSRVKEMTEYRLKTQPWKEATAGCFFRNPEVNAEGRKCSAGSWIEQVGLKGFRIGSAQVSSKHANFLINTGNATAQDFLQLCKQIRLKVQDNCGIDLIGEVRYLEYGSNHTTSI